MNKLLVASVVGVAGLTASANATVLFDSVGFEAPAYAVGTIEGQNGWQNDNPGHGLHTVVAGPQGTVTPIGSQMLKVTQAASGTRWSFPDVSVPVAARPVGENDIWCKVDFNNPTGTTTTQFFGIGVYNSLGAQIAGIRIRPSDGLLVATFDPDGAGPTGFGNFSLGSPALAIPRDTWINLGVSVNLVTGVVNITSGNTVLSSGTAGAGFATLSDFDVMAGGAAAGQSIYLDNYIVTSESAVPAPGAAALIGLGGLCAVRRRR